MSLKGDSDQVPLSPDKLPVVPGSPREWSGCVDKTILAEHILLQLAGEVVSSEFVKFRQIYAQLPAGLSETN